MSILFPCVILFFLCVGTVFILLSAIGFIRLRYIFTRLHALALSSTLGVGSLLIASIGYHFFYLHNIQPSEILITAFLFITAPISSHLLAKTALRAAQQTDPPAPSTGSSPSGSTAQMQTQIK